MLYAIGTICISYLGCGGPQNSEIVFPRAIFIDEISLVSHFPFVIIHKPILTSEMNSLAQNELI